MKTIYLISSLRSKRIPDVAASLREIGFDVFDDWYAAGPEADDYWKAYEEERGSSYIEALQGYAAKHVHDFDLHHLGRADMGLLALPAGKSGHLELGYLIGQGKPGFILLDANGFPGKDRWDVMYRFATRVFTTSEDMVTYFKENPQ